MQFSNFLPTNLNRNSLQPTSQPVANFNINMITRSMCRFGEEDSSLPESIKSYHQLHDAIPCTFCLCPFGRLGRNKVYILLVSKNTHSLTNETTRGANVNESATDDMPSLRLFKAELRYSICLTHITSNTWV